MALVRRPIARDDWCFCLRVHHVADLCRIALGAGIPEKTEPIGSAPYHGLKRGLGLDISQFIRETGPCQPAWLTSPRR
jgi:hypothetical protein